MGLLQLAEEYRKKLMITPSRQEYLDLWLKAKKIAGEDFKMFNILMAEYRLKYLKDSD